MENKAHALAAGLFVLLAGCLLLALAFWLTRDTGVRVPYEVVTREAVNGLQPQAAVRYRGVPVGKVVALGFDPQQPGQVLIRIAVDANTPVTRSTFASLGFLGVTGLSFIELDDRGESSERLPANVTPVPRIPMRPGLLGQLSERGARLVGQLEESSQRLNQMLSPQRQQALFDSVRAIGEAAQSVPPLAQQGQASLREMQQAAKDVSATALSLRVSAQEFNQLSQRLQAREGLLDQANAAAQTVQSETLPRLNRTLDEVARAARQAAQAASTLNDNPQALLFGDRPPAPGPGEPGFTSPSP